MKTTATYIFAAMIACSAYTYAATPAVPTVPVSNVSVNQDERTLSVSMDIDASNLSLSSPREIIVHPVLSDSTGNQVNLPGVYLAGRSRYYLHLREADIAAPDTLVRAKGAGIISYTASVPYEQWMQLSNLDMAYDLRGCACSPLDRATTPLAAIDFTPLTFVPAFVTMTPQASGVKNREIKGSAYIDFPVNRTELYTDYRRNPEELARIRASIDVVRNDPDAKITSITIKGYASPEGSYSNNVRLAKGRTQTLRDYVQGLYAFDPSIMHSDWEAEDWAGLRRYVEKSDLEWREPILRLIDSDMEPDAKDRKLRLDYPKDYAFLLANVYPGLRHSDYAVEYVIRTYTDINEIAAVMKSNPSKLSLNELFLLGQSLDPESQDYADVFELAVRMFPNDSVANLNAAVINMRRADYAAAQRYLERAGDSTQAIYARGILQAFMEQYADARNTLTPIAATMPEAADAVAQIEKILRRTSGGNSK